MTCTGHSASPPLRRRSAGGGGGGRLWQPLGCVSLKREKDVMGLSEAEHVPNTRNVPMRRSALPPLVFQQAEAPRGALLRQEGLTGPSSSGSQHDAGGRVSADTIRDRCRGWAVGGCVFGRGWPARCCGMSSVRVGRTWWLTKTPQTSAWLRGGHGSWKV